MSLLAVDQTPLHYACYRGLRWRVDVISFLVMLADVYLMNSDFGHKEKVPYEAVQTSSRQFQLSHKTIGDTTRFISMFHSVKMAAARSEKMLHFHSTCSWTSHSNTTPFKKCGTKEMRNTINLRRSKLPHRRSFFLVLFETLCRWSFRRRRPRVPVHIVLSCKGAGVFPAKLA